MTNDENRTARQIIKKWMPLAIYPTLAMGFIYYYWIDPKETLYQSLLNVSTTIPLFLLFSTFIIEVGGLLMHGFLLGLEAIETIKSMRLARALDPIAYFVAALFLTAKRKDISETTSDSELIEIMKEFCEEKTVKVDTKRVKKNARKFLNEIASNIGAEWQVIGVKDLLERDIFADEVVKHIRETLPVNIDEWTMHVPKTDEDAENNSESSKK